MVPPLKLGHYRLTRDVKNPRGDARRKYDKRLIPVWKKGMKIFVREDTIEVAGIEVAYQVMCLGGMSNYEISLHSGAERGQYAELIAALEPVAEGLDELLIRLGGGSNSLELGLLRELLALGKISLADIEAASESRHERNKQR